MDKIGPAQAASSDLPKGAKRLFDLVRPKNSSLAPVFYFALKEVLVASNLDEAKHWAYNHLRRHRVVTLDGRIIDERGVMTGGGREQQRGGMRSKKHSSITPEQIEVLRQDLAARQAEYNALGMQLEQHEHQLQQLHQESLGVEARLRRISIDMDSLPQQLEHLQEHLLKLQKTTEAPSKELLARIHELEQKLQKERSNLDLLQSQSEPLRDQIASLQKQIMDAGGINYRAQQSKVNGLREQEELLRRKELKLGATRTTLETFLKSEQPQSNNKPQIEELERQLAEIEAEMHGQEAKLVENNREKNAAMQVCLLFS